MKVVEKTPVARQLSLDADGIQAVYAKHEKKLRALAYKAIVDNGHSIDFIARLAEIQYPEQLGRALNGKGTHVPARVYAVLLDPTIDPKRIFVTGIAALARGEFQARPEISDAEFRRRVESFARQDEMAALIVRKAVGGES